MTDFSAPFLGTAYYPEDWPVTLVDEDIAKMKESGVRVARIAEFAWDKMEPEEGVFSFGWLHYVVDKLAAAGIGVVLGTPTATPPLWMAQKYPDALKLNENGTRVSHGARRNYCSNHPDYQRLSLRVVEAMGREFGHDPAVIGWQLDNEIYSFGGCVCDCCKNHFHAYLRKKYQNIDALNAAWNCGVFSQTYPSFDDVVIPIRAWHNPHLRYEWLQAQFNADIEFIHAQADVLRPLTDAPIGTDMMPTNGMSYEKMTAPLDIVQFNHYNTKENLSDVVFWFDYLRTLKEKPFWNTETATVWNGSVVIDQVIKPEGFTRINSWLPVALGGACNMYWLWRQHWGGQELNHGAVLWPDGQYFYAAGEIRQTAEEFARAGDFLSRTRVSSSEVALLFSSAAQTLFDVQPIIPGNDYRKNLCDWHRALLHAGITPDVIGVNHSLEPYKMLVTPFALTLEDEDGGHTLTDRIRTFVENGGTWVVGPMTDVRDRIGAHYLHSMTGILEEMTGAVLTDAIPSDGTVLKLADGRENPVAHSRWVEAFTMPENAEVLVRINSGHRALNGRAVVASIPVGRGHVVICGTFLSDKMLQDMLTDCANASGVTPYEVNGEGVIVIPRKTPGAEGIVVCETANAPGSVKLHGIYRDLLHSKQIAGPLSVEPYGVYVLQKI